MTDLSAPISLLRSHGTHRLQDGTRIRDHELEVPLDYADPQGRRLSVFAREYTAEGGESRPWLLYLQGGPGGRGARSGPLSGWMAEAITSFRILMLDQRGTGRSTPVTRSTLPREGDSVQQAVYLSHFRAPNIVRDAEQLRMALGSGPWTTLGQSFGGFCTLTYLSLHPDGLRASLITGGLPPITGPADRVYQATYGRMRARNREFFDRYPGDWALWERIVRLGRHSEQRFPDGSPITIGRLQMLGMYLGGNTRVDQLHYLLQDAFAEGEDRLSDTFLEQAHGLISHTSRPLYMVMHESIYAQPEAEPTNWAAQRVLSDHADFDPERTPTPLLTGEMVFPWYAELDPALQPLAGAAAELARRTGWDSLYDLDRLAANTVPVAAAVYRDDVYVDAELSLETASRVPGLTVWQTGDHHHDGLGEDGAGIFRRLYEMVSSPSSKD
ncbi:MAG: alpha/beta fold hydrolase [Micrococcaceae bacterium]